MAEKSVMNTKSALIDSWQRKAAEYQRLKDSPKKSDQEKASKLSAEIDDIRSELARKESGRLGDIAGGTLSGVLNSTVGLVGLAGIPLTNKLFGTNLPTPLELAKKGAERAGIPMQATEDTPVSRGLFGAFEGGSSALVGPGSAKVKALMASISTPAGAIDGVADSNIALPAALVGGLAAGGVQAARQNQKQKAVAELLSGMSEQDRALLNKLTVSQASGVRNPNAIAAEKMLATSPKYAEIYQLIRNGQADEVQAALKAMTPQAPTVTMENFAPQVHKGYGKAVERLTTKLKEDGDKWFKKAFEAVDPSAKLFPVDNTIKILDAKIAQFSDEGSDSAKNVVRFLKQFRNDIVEQKPNWSVNNLQPEPTGKTSLAALQGQLKAFGADAAKGEGMLAGVSLNDQKRAASAIFSGLKEDLAAAKLSTEPGVRQAAVLLDRARDITKRNHETLTEFVEKKLPASFVDKPMEALTSETLLNTFKKLPPSQRLGAMQVLDSYNPDLSNKVRQSIYEDLIKPKSGVQDGVTNFSLEDLVKRYDDAVKKDPTLYKFVLGSQADDLKERIDTVRKMIRTAEVMPEEAAGAKAMASIGADTAGVVGGAQSKYGIHALQKIWEMIKGSNLTQDDLAKLLLAPEGKDFLKNLPKTKTAEETLESLAKLRSVQNPLFPGKEVAANAAVQGAAKAADMNAPVQSVELDQEPQTNATNIDLGSINLVTDTGTEPEAVKTSAPVADEEIKLVFE